MYFYNVIKEAARNSGAELPRKLMIALERGELAKNSSRGRKTALPEEEEGSPGGRWEFFSRSARSTRLHLGAVKPPRHRRGRAETRKRPGKTSRRAMRGEETGGGGGEGRGALFRLGCGRL